MCAYLSVQSSYYKIPCLLSTTTSRPWQWPLIVILRMAHVMPPVPMTLHCWWCRLRQWRLMLTAPTLTSQMTIKLVSYGDEEEGEREWDRGLRVLLKGMYQSVKRPLSFSPLPHTPIKPSHFFTLSLSSSLHSYFYLQFTRSLLPSIFIPSSILPLFLSPSHP